MTWRQHNARCVRVKSARLGDSYMKELLVDARAAKIIFILMCVVGNMKSTSYYL